MAVNFDAATNEKKWLLTEESELRPKPQKEREAIERVYKKFLELDVFHTSADSKRAIESLKQCKEGTFFFRPVQTDHEDGIYFELFVKRDPCKVETSTFLLSAADGSLYKIDQNNSKKSQALDSNRIFAFLYVRMSCRRILTESLKCRKIKHAQDKKPTIMIKEYFDKFFIRSSGVIS